MSRHIKPRPVLLVLMAVVLAAHMAPAHGFAWRLFAGRYDGIFDFDTIPSRFLDLVG